MLLALAVGTLILPQGAGARQTTLRINCTIHSAYEAFFFRLVREVCAANNLEARRNTPPVGRSLLNVNQGIDDGDGPRIAGLSESFPNMVAVPEPFGEFAFGAFAKRKDIRLNGWPGLAELNVAYVIGWKIFDERVEAAKSIVRVKDADLLFRLLAAGRADVVLTTKLAGYAAMKKLGLAGVRFLEPPLARKANFLYLHKRHKALAPLLARTLRQLKINGRYDALHQEMILPHLSERAE